MSKSEKEKEVLHCSFCGKSQHEVKKLIAGPNVFICDECVDLCIDIIREENKASPLGGDSDKVPTPREIREHLFSILVVPESLKLQKHFFC